MNVQLTIEANQMGETVIDLFKNLPAEKKEELALEVLKEWFKEPVQIETLNYEHVLLEKFREGELKPLYGYNVNDTKLYTVEQLKNDYRWKEEIEKYKNSKQYMIEEIRKEIVAYYKKSIKVQIETDPIIAQIKEATYEIIRDSFPDLIKEVMIQVFAANIQNLSHKIQETAREVYISKDTINTIKEKLGGI
jgi:hypothetical protein